MYALVVSGTDTFVDGNWENSAALSGGAHLTPTASGMARYLATYANHSARRPMP